MIRPNARGWCGCFSGTRNRWQLYHRNGFGAGRGRCTFPSDEHLARACGIAFLTNLLACGLCRVGRSTGGGRGCDAHGWRRDLDAALLCRQDRPAKIAGQRGAELGYLRIVLRRACETIGGCAIVGRIELGLDLRPRGLKSVDQHSAYTGRRHQPDNRESLAREAHYAGRIPVCRGTWTGLFVTPADQARPQVDLTAFQAPQVASKANTPVYTIGGVPFVGRSYELNLGNDVQPRLLFNSERIVIVDRAEVLSLTVEAVPMATYNPYQRAIERTRTAIVIEHGTIAGRKVKIETPTAVQRRPTGIENQQGVVEWPLTFTPLPTDAGDDQWTITLT